MDTYSHIDANSHISITNCSDHSIRIFSAGHLLDEKSPTPEDIIAPRVLTPGGLLVFGGAPKIGKSDFLLCKAAHMSAGLKFLGMGVPRPLKIMYLQAEIGYPYLCERLKSMRFDSKYLPLIRENLYCTPQIKAPLDERSLAEVIKSIRHHFGTSKVDVIIVDPLRNFFDGSDENDNSGMLHFMQKRLEVLRAGVNPDAGIILVHHTKKATRSQLEDDPFQILAGASCIRGYYSSGILMYQPDPQKSYCKLLFELRNGKKLAPKCVDKIEGDWCEIDEHSIN